MKKVLSGVIILMILSFIFVVSYPDLIFSKPSPAAEKGTINLTQWDFAKNGAVQLNGEWELYDGQLLSPADFHGSGTQKPELTGYVNLTSSRTLDGKDTPKSPKGIRTYRLVMKVNPSRQVFGLSVDNVKMSNRVYVNGVVQGQSGNPAEENKGYAPLNCAYDSYFQTEGNQVEILLQVANFDYPFSGTQYKVDFGLQKDIGLMSTTTTAIELAGALLNLLFGIFYLGIYSIRKKDKSFLYFSIQFFVLSIMVLVNGEKLILLLLPGLSFELLAKLQLFTVVLITMLMPMIAVEVHENLLSAKMIRTATVIGVAYLLFCLLAPYSVYVNLHGVRDVVTTGILIFIIIQLITASTKENYGTLGKRGTIMFVCSTACLCICLVNNFLYAFCYVHTKMIGSVAACGFTIITALTVGYRFVLMYENMEKMDKVKDEFIAKTSYELKAPLYGIINIAETMIKENSDALNEKSLKDIIITKNIALRLSGIVNDTLDVTLLRNGQLKLSLSVIDIKVCINLIMESAKYIIQNREITIFSSITESWLVKADENRVRQILYNLINYFVQKMSSGIIRMSAEKKNHMVYLTVESTGYEVLKEQVEELKPYETLTVESGGLELYITRQLVELMGGTICLDVSEIGGGNRFIFSLPCAGEDTNLPVLESQEDMNHFIAQPSLTYPEAEYNTKHEITILIVDDEVFNIQSALNIFRREGYNVLIAYSGEDALKKVENEKIDLILLDVMMPGISGIDVCRKIRKKYSVIELPILISTVKNMDYNLFLGFEAGANDFITKPFEEEEIIARTKTLIEMKKAMENAVKNELAFLQAQIKPHFLYNAINTMISFCYTDSEKAAKLLTNFSKYLRLTFDVDNHSMMIPLSRELEMIAAYVEIEKARFGDKINIEYHIDEALMGEIIPQLSIQPLVENAIKHGLCKKEKGGRIFVTVVKREGVITITVRDTGVGMSAEKLQALKNPEVKNEGIGFSNISKRIRKLHNAHMEIESTEGVGTTVTITVKD